MPNYPKEQLWPLYNKLPKNLQEALFAEKSGVSIGAACGQVNITDEKAIFEVSKQTGYVLLGLLAPNELAGVFEKELALEKNIAEQLSARINNSIFLPVKESLEALYQSKIEKIPEIEIKPVSQEEKTQPIEQAATKKDPYREPIE